MADNEIAKADQNLPEATDPLDLMPHEGLVDQVQEIIEDLAVVKREALEGFYIFKDLLANEGEGSAATKEQMAAMLQIYLSTVDTRLKTVDTLVKAKKGSNKAGGSGTNINIMSGTPALTRREMLEEIEKIVDIDSDQIEVVDDTDPEDV